MPYYLFRISEPDALKIVKQLDLVETFENFREAKNAARQLRAGSAEDDSVYKVMFAESRLSAEEQLLEKREQPVLMEHER